MVRQRKIFIDWFLVTAAAVLGSCCMCASLAQAQPAVSRTSGQASAQPDPILTAQLPPTHEPIASSRMQSQAMPLYQRAIRELHRGKAASAEKDARRSFALDPEFGDAEALAATAALSQRQFKRARDDAERATQIAPNDATAWIALATADNYLARYAEAADALNAIPPQSRLAWQVSYQRARAEAGQDHGAAALEWANRAALTAPRSFAPLHLLLASALLAANQYRQSADELESYLSLLGNAAPQREGLTRELVRIRGLQKSHSGAAAEAEYAALVN